jgi:uncharacterized protein YbjQ (UPF0145 family)
MILVTTEGVAGREAVECMGLVAAESLVRPSSAQMFTLSGDKWQEIRAQLMYDAREEVLDRLATIAAERGADAVVAIRLDYELVDPSYGALMATGAGTAVKLGPGQAA